LNIDQQTDIMIFPGAGNELLLKTASQIVGSSAVHPTSTASIQRGTRLHKHIAKDVGERYLLKRNLSSTEFVENSQGFAVSSGRIAR
jgi:hypothetical protein